jgi:4-hydroxy-tetrahydrodipicolinate synthase
MAGGAPRRRADSGALVEAPHMFRGSIVAVVTPFKDDGSIDLNAYGRLIDMHLERGTHGIVPCGCTGEAATLSHDEQKQLIKFCVERVAGRIPVVAGAGSNNTREAIDLTRFAKDVGADAVLSITPYYNKPTREGQIAHYRAIAEKVDIPIMLYNVPGRTGTNMEPQTVAELDKIPNIVSIKEAAGSLDQVSQIRSLCPINILSGDDSLTLPMMAVGASGVVSVAANVAPDKVAALCDEWDNGNVAAAQALHYELMPLFKALFVQTNPLPVKAVLAHMGLIKNNLRLPLTPLPPDKFAQIKPVIEQLHLVTAAV